MVWQKKYVKIIDNKTAKIIIEEEWLSMYKVFSILIALNKFSILPYKIFSMKKIHCNSHK